MSRLYILPLILLLIYLNIISNPPILIINITKANLFNAFFKRLFRRNQNRCLCWRQQISWNLVKIILETRPKAVLATHFERSLNDEAFRYFLDTPYILCAVLKQPLNMFYVSEWKIIFLFRIWSIAKILCCSSTFFGNWGFWPPFRIGWWS